MKKRLFCILSVLLLSACSYQQETDISVSANSIPYLFLNEDLYTEYDMRTIIPIYLNNQDVFIDEPGTYLISGILEDGQITISAPADTTIRLVLNNVTLASSTKPAIEVVDQSKVQISTSSDSLNTITSNNEAISSHGTLVLNGQGTLVITSQYDGIHADQEIIITGGNYQIDSQKNAISALETIAVLTGSFDINASQDALHCGSEESPGYIYLQDGSYDIHSQQDGLHCKGAIMIESAQMNIDAQDQSIYSQSNLELTRAQSFFSFLLNVKRRQRVFLHFYF